MLCLVTWCDLGRAHCLERRGGARSLPRARPRRDLRCAQRRLHLGEHPYRLYDGAQLVVTESIYVDRDGTALDEQPLPADHPGPPADAPAAALTWLADHGCAAR